MATHAARSFYQLAHHPSLAYPHIEHAAHGLWMTVAVLRDLLERGLAVLAQKLAAGLMEHGVYVTAFSFPVVPRGEARIRTQMSPGLTREQLDQAVAAFTDVGRELKVIS